MSVAISIRVWTLSRHSGTELLMMLAIADFAHDDGTAYPSIATLALKTRMQTRNARYIVRRLQDSGELTIKPNAGPRGCNVFRINLTQPLQAAARCKPLHSASACTLQAAAPLQSNVATPANLGIGPLQPAASEPLLNRQESLSMSRGPDRSRETRGILEYLNERAGREYRPVESNLALIRSRLDSGVTVQQCKQVIDAKVAEWQGNPKMDRYLCPGTLFRPAKFEQYLGALGGKSASQVVPQWIALGYGSEAEMLAQQEMA